MKSYLTFLSLLISVLSFGQQKIVVIEDSDRSEVKYKKYKEPSKKIEVDNSWAFKFAPTHMVVGEINFSLEKAVGERTSLEFELGPTVSELSTTRLIIVPTTEAQRNASLGIVASAAVRYYPMDDATVMNGFYVSPKFRFRQYNVLYTYEFDNIGDKKGAENQLGFLFNIGSQFWLSQTFAMDVYGGFGLNYRNETIYRVNSVYEPMDDTFSNTWTSTTNNSVAFILQLGLKVGIGN